MLVIFFPPSETHSPFFCSSEFVHIFSFYLLLRLFLQIRALIFSICIPDSIFSESYSTFELFQTNKILAEYRVVVFHSNSFLNILFFASSICFIKNIIFLLLTDYVVSLSPSLSLSLQTNKCFYSVIWLFEISMCVCFIQ